MRKKTGKKLAPGRNTPYNFSLLIINQVIHWMHFIIDINLYIEVKYLVLNEIQFNVFSVCYENYDGTRYKKSKLK